jgi:PAS domain S-box-containing protein
MKSLLTNELRRLFDTAPVGMAVTSREGVVLDANRALGDLLGYSAQDLVGRSLSDLTALGPNETTHRTTFARVGATNIAISRDRQLRRKDGSLFPASVTSSMLHDAEGNPAALVQAIVDRSARETNVERLTAELAARERAEGEAREAHDFLVAALQALPVGVLVVDRPSGKPLFANARFEAVHGPSTDPAPAPAVTREDGVPYAAAERPLARTLEDGAPHSITDAWRVGARGEKVAVTEHSAPISFRGRDAALLVVQDVTALRDHERQRRAAERLYRDLFEQVNDAILVVTKDDAPTIVDVNPAGERLYGYARAELMSRPVSALSPSEQPDGQRSEAALAARIDSLGSEAVVRFPWRATRKGGEPVEVEMTLKQLRIEGSPDLLIIQARDVTRQRLLEDDLRQAQKQEAVGVLAGGLAHDYNNLLTGVMGFIDLALTSLERPGGADANRLKKLLGQAQRGASRSADLTRQLLAFSRKSVGRIAVIDLNEAVTKALEMIRPIIGEAISVELGLSSEACAVRGDPAQLEQVLVNLAINARDAMPKGGKMRIETRRVRGEGEDSVVLAVSDDGLGMSEAVRARIFEPFFTTKAEGRGTGLGLAVVKSVVQRHGGRVEVESTAGRGCTFTVTLPAAPETVGLAAAPPESAIPRGEAKLLVVDDDSLVRDATASMLEALGYTVVTADGALAALEKIAAHDFDLVISDVVMPGVSGVELEQRLRRERPGLKVLLVSGYAEEAFARHGIDESSVEALLRKPLTLSSLGRKVHEILRGR